jgi:hypothetical protein
MLQGSNGHPRDLAFWPSVLHRQRILSNLISFERGSAALPFSAEAISLIAGSSRGIPRLVNSICDNALLSGHAGGDSWITVDQVRQVLRDLDLTDRISGNAARLETEQLDAAVNGAQSPVQLKKLEKFRLPPRARAWGAVHYALGQQAQLRHCAGRKVGSQVLREHFAWWRYVIKVF